VSPRFVTEVCVGDPAGVACAAAAGADRAELCANLLEGGTTPSVGAMRRARALAPALGLMVMIRPRGGDFLYSDEEYRVMEEDVDAAKEAGADGVVFGLLRHDGTVDVERTRALAERARPMSVTFHRAFDVAEDPRRALEELILAGVDRVLTSGQRARASEAVGLLRELVELAGDRLVVLLGGLELADAAEVAAATGVGEVHFAALSSSESPMTHRNEAVPMGAGPPPGEYELEATDPARVRAFLETLRAP
jgi:copper homeostasis protein